MGDRVRVGCDKFAGCYIGYSVSKDDVDSPVLRFSDITVPVGRLSQLDSYEPQFSELLEKLLGQGFFYTEYITVVESEDLHIYVYKADKMCGYATTGYHFYVKNGTKTITYKEIPADVVSSKRIQCTYDCVSADTSYFWRQLACELFEKPEHGIYKLILQEDCTDDDENIEIIWDEEQGR